LGPVSNLEEHVRHDWWRRIFNATYLKTDGDVVDDLNITRNEVDYFSELLHLSAEDKILDLCCGLGRHSLELARKGFKEGRGIGSVALPYPKSEDACKEAGLPRSRL
jgi:D-alanine-D-alanine ligase